MEFVWCERMNFAIEEQYQNALVREKAKLKGPKNTVELFSCVEELFRKQPFHSKFLNVHGRPDAFWSSVEFQIHNLVELNCFLKHY